MQKTEQQFLVSEKEINGWDRDKAWKSVNDLTKAEKAFKILWHEKKELENKVNKLEKELALLKSKNFKLKFSLDKSKATKQELQPKVYQGSLFQLRRIINFMEKEKPYSKKSLSKELCMSNSDLGSCLDFLNEFKVLNLEVDFKGQIIRK